MWILPTYNRPKQAQATLDSIAQAGCQTEGVVYVDGPHLQEYQELRLPPRWKVFQGEINRGVCSVLNHFFSMHPDLSWYGFISDDSIVRTFEWDRTTYLNWERDHLKGVLARIIIIHGFYGASG